MDNDIKQMLEVILNRFDKVDERFDRVDNRLDNGWSSRHDGWSSRQNGQSFKRSRKWTTWLRLEMKEEIRGIDTKIDLIYNKLNSDMEQIKTSRNQNLKSFVNNKWEPASHLFLMLLDYWMSTFSFSNPAYVVAACCISDC